jgi:protein-tyrosine phosphatase
MAVPFIDFHLHLLPGLDDGSASLVETIRMVEELFKLGFTTLVCTPHQKQDSINPSRSSIEQVFAAVCEEVEDHLPDVELLLGAENYYDAQLSTRLGEKDVPTIHDSDTFLLEFPPSIDEKSFKTALFRVQMEGYSPIIAHVERYRNLNHKILSGVSEDFFLQVNLTSFLKENSDLEQRSRAIKYFEKELVSLFATDMHTHHMVKRLAKAMDWTRQRFGEDVLDRFLGTNPRRILEQMGPSPRNRP